MVKGIFIVGTDTDVGKTFVTAGITYILRKHHYNACAFKPVQSGSLVEENHLLSGDAKFVKEVTQIKEPLSNLNTYSFREAVSPHLAAEIEERLIEQSRILQTYAELGKEYDYIIAEGSGGIIVPLIRGQYYIYDLIKDLQIPVIIVARSTVGTINHTVLTVEFLKQHKINIKGIIFNGYQGTFYEDDNIKTIKQITGIEVVAVLHRIASSNQENFIHESRNEYTNSLHKEKVLKIFED